MLLHRIAFLLLFLCCANVGVAQNYSYHHYNVNNGLVGNQVYTAVQDKEGFMWFATETGVSRFDGTQFKNFTTADGLPDNEIVRLYTDKKGRVWMLPFTSSLCYYDHGVIHTPDNDSTLSRIQLTQYVSAITEDRAGNLFFLTENFLYVLLSDNQVLIWTNKKLPKSRFVLIGSDMSGHCSIALKEQDSLSGKEFISFYFLEVKGNDLVLTKDKNIPVLVEPNNYSGLITSRFTVYCLAQYIALGCDMYVLDKTTGRSSILKVPPGTSTYNVIDDSIFYFNTSTGVHCINSRDNLLRQRYLEQENISCSLRDNEDNLWFCSLGNGIWRLSSANIRNITDWGDKIGVRPVNAITRFDNDIILGSENRRLMLLDAATGVKKQLITLADSNLRRHLRLVPYKEDLYLLAELGLFIRQAKGDFVNEILFGSKLQPASLKDMDVSKTGMFAIASNFGVSFFKKQSDKLQFVRVVGGRTTAVAFADSLLYVGTLEGLKSIAPDGKEIYYNKIDPLLATRITKLLYDGEYLWIGTNNQGLVCFDGRKVIRTISTKEGLTGNIIRALYLSGHYLWVGTDRGLNKIETANRAFSVDIKYTMADGLPTNIINAIYVDKNMVYVGTSEGLAFFDEEQMGGNSRCDLRILGITVSGKALQYGSEKLILQPKDNNIRFDFVGISFKSGGDIIYEYKLVGLDNTTQFTKENYLQYPTLPSGNYRFEIQATNKFGIQSELLVIPFEVKKTLMEETWFLVLAILAALGLVWWLANMRIKHIRKREREKTTTIRRIAELEQQALKAQMNPHFIFNCLNSIQQYVIDKDVEGANRFISGFSKLIRQTLDNSGRQLISIGEEYRFLQAYLELEKNRFEGKFDYVIRLDERILPEELMIPPMLVQPYVENSIRHGMRLKPVGTGLIEINILLWNNHLICSIIDNGVGRKAAEAYKSARHIEYQSKGINLTSQRIEMLNAAIYENITVSIEDLYDSSGTPAGTKVTLTLPLQYDIKQH